MSKGMIFVTGASRGIGKAISQEDRKGHRETESSVCSSHDVPGFDSLEASMVRPPALQEDHPHPASHPTNLQTRSAGL